MGITGVVNPGTDMKGSEGDIAAHNQIRAHAAAYRAYQADFATSQGGKVGITLNVNWGQPRDEADAGDIQASEDYLNFNLGWYAHAIFVDGKYPEVRMRTTFYYVRAVGLMLCKSQELIEQVMFCCS